MRVLVLHNRYRQLGGEDLVSRAEVELLRSRGLEVFHHEVDNGEEGGSALGMVNIVLSSAWSQNSGRMVAELCEKYKPDVAHVHNFWMTLSPSVHAACRAAGVATVQTLHNFRLFCANGLLLRDGKICEDCLGRSPMPGIIHRCYRNSLVASTAVARMIAVNRQRGTWQTDVDAYIALSEFSRSRYIAGGLPAEKIWIKPNFVEDPGVAPTPPSQSQTVLFIGRLSPEKGVSTLIEAWSKLKTDRPARLLILGDGPERNNLEARAQELHLTPSQITFAGLQKPDAVKAALMNARTVVLPSVWYENFPRVIAETFSCGRPMVVSRLGAQKEIVTDARLGWTFSPSDANALAASLTEMLNNDQLVDQYGRNAREEYLRRYSPGENYRLLLDIYHHVAAKSSSQTARLAMT